MRSRFRSLILAGFASFQAAPSPAQAPSAAPAGTASDLGSPAQPRARFTADYRAAVEAALPRVAAADLSRRLRAAVAEDAAANPLAVRDAGAWTALFGVEPSADRSVSADELVEGKEASYLVAPQSGRLYMTIRRPDAKPYAREAFKQMLPRIRRAHQALAQRVGIPARQVFFTDFRETLAQSTPGSPAEGREGPIESAGATTTLLRAVGGVLVDGSFALMSSVNAEQIEMVDVRWPRVLLAPEVDVAKVVAPSELAARIAERIAADAKGQAVTVRMAVVLRPLRHAHRSYFVPSLRVGVLPATERVADAGYRTEAGQEFYLDLVPGLADLEERDERELVPGTSKPKEDCRESGS